MRFHDVPAAERTPRTNRQTSQQPPPLYRSSSPPTMCTMQNPLVVHPEADTVRTIIFWPISTIPLLSSAGSMPLIDLYFEAVGIDDMSGIQLGRWREIWLFPQRNAILLESRNRLGQVIDDQVDVREKWSGIIPHRHEVDEAVAAHLEIRMIRVVDREDLPETHFFLIEVLRCLILIVNPDDI